MCLTQDFDPYFPLMRPLQPFQKLREWKLQLLPLMNNQPASRCPCQTWSFSNWCNWCQSGLCYMAEFSYWSMSHKPGLSGLLNGVRELIIIKWMDPPSLVLPYAWGASVSSQNRVICGNDCRWFMRYKSVLTFFIITIALGIPSIYLHFLTTSSPSRGIEDIYVKTSNHWSSFQKKPSGTLQAEVGNTTWTSSTCATPSAIPDWCPPSSRRTLYIAPSAGLGNVLQTIASALTVAKRKKFNVKLVLQSRTFGSTSWGELFLEPALSEINGTFPDGSGLPKMTKACIVQDHFVEWKDIKIKWKNTGHQDVLCASTCCWKEPPFPHSVLWFYKSLVPAQAIQRSIQEFQEQLRWHNFQWVWRVCFQCQYVLYSCEIYGVFCVNGATANSAWYSPSCMSFHLPKFYWSYHNKCFCTAAVWT